VKDSRENVCPDSKPFCCESKLEDGGGSPLGALVFLFVIGGIMVFNVCLHGIWAVLKYSKREEDGSVPMSEGEACFCFGWQARGCVHDDHMSQGNFCTCVMLTTVVPAVIVGVVITIIIVVTFAAS
jgi:hypothetical protein